MVVKAIGVGPDPSGLGLDEGKGEGIEAFGRAQSDEAVGPLLDVDIEPVGMRLAHPAVDAIGGDNEVEFPPGIEVGVALMSIM